MMAHSQIRSMPGPAPIAAKMSYSKIAAMPAPNSSITPNATRKTVNNPPPPPNNSSDGPFLPKRQDPEPHEAPPAQPVQMPADGLRFPLGRLSLADNSIDIRFSEQNGDSGDSYEEDRSQVSTSSLNKPQSFDTKSLASVTTFAMDDKESIRPDDSASVRAVDDDHTQPILSRNSSFQHEVEPTVHRSLHRSSNSNVTIPSRRFPTLVNPPKFGNFSSLPISPVLECQDLALPHPPVPVMSPDEPRDVATVVELPPDEKLIEALASVKDRLPLLQLEEKFLAFIANPSAEILELPPQNGFTRLLTHRLADYYNLAHQNTEDNSSVRISRSGIRTLPTPLSEITKAIPIGSANGPNSAAVKIMRREQLGGRQFSAGNSTAPSSSVPSKTTSENGNEGRSEDGLVSPTESTPNRDKSKLTREEREAQYKVVRDRIFGDMQESVGSELTSTGENSADMSRSSSSSGRKKHRKNKQPKDDSFEARSAFVQSFAPMQGHYNHPYAEHNMTGGYPTSPVSFDPTVYGAMPPPAYASFDNNMAHGNMPPYSPNMMQQYGHGEWQTLQATQNGYFMYSNGMGYPPNPGMMMAHNQIMQTPTPDWYGAPYPPGMPGMQSMGPGSHYLPHVGGDVRSPPLNDQFGRPFHRPHSTSSMHSSGLGPKGNKSLFNPQTRSFVPSNAESRSGNRGGRAQKQGRSSVGSYAQAAVANTNGSSSKHEDSLKQRYGSPPSLPKKPPPLDGKSSTDAGVTTLPVTTGAVSIEVTSMGGITGPGPLVVNGGSEQM